MRNPKMIKNISVKCMAAIMGAAAVMSPATAAMGIVIEADAIDYETINDITPDGQNNLNLEVGDTLATNPEGNTIHNNAGTITTNNGTVANNSGMVEVNYGEVTGGQVGDNYGTAEHAQISDNYGTASNSSVTNNYASGRVTGDSTVTDNYGGYIENTNDSTQQHPTYSGPNPLPTPAPAPQPSGDSGDVDDPAPVPSPQPATDPQPVDNTGSDSPSMGSLTVLPSETHTMQQEEKTFVNTLSSEMAKLGNESGSASATPGATGQQTINVNMGTNNSYTPRMINALEKATDKNFAVAMAVSEDGQRMTFTVPANSDYSAANSYFEQTGSPYEGFRMIQSLVSGSSIEDASRNKIVNTTDTGTLNIKADADAVTYGINHFVTIYGGKGNPSSSNNPGAAFAITDGGTATDTTVNGGGSQTLHFANTAMTAGSTSGGIAMTAAVTSDGTVTSGGTATISAGTMGDIAMTAAGTSGGTVTSGGTIPSGGGTIPSGGTVTMSKVTSGGTAIDTTVNGGGSQTASGDIATSAIAINGGSQTEIGRIYAGGTVVATGTLPDTASQSGTYAVTDDRSVLIANDQGVFLASKGSIQKLE